MPDICLSQVLHAFSVCQVRLALLTCRFLLQIFGVLLERASLPVVSQI
jgi:hypothetical protein